VVRPYPWEQLPRLRRRDVVALRHVRAHLRGRADALRRWARRHLGEGSPVALKARASARTVDQLRRLIDEGALALALQGPDGARATLVLDRRVTSLLVGMLLHTDPRPLVGPATAAEQGLALYATASLLLELGADCVWNATTAGAAELDDDLAAIEGELRLGGHAGLCWLLLARELAPRLSDRHDDCGQRQRLEGVALGLPVELGRVPLPDAAELELLGAGDIIVSPSCPRVGTTTALLRVGATGMCVTIEGDQLRVGSRGHGGVILPTTGERERGHLAGQLPVELVIELGRVRLSAAQVMTLGTGDVVTLERDVGAAVDLRVGDRLLGRGELVDVEGDAGVRVVEVFD
jgi:type III secretion system YscQ/HrcQ family protein